jgi:hypothetical protein
LYGKIIITLRNCRTAVHSSILYFHQQYMKVSTSQNPCQYLVLLSFSLFDCSHVIGCYCGLNLPFLNDLDFLWDLAPLKRSSQRHLELSTRSTIASRWWNESGSSFFHWSILRQDLMFLLKLRNHFFACTLFQH